MFFRFGAMNSGKSTALLQVAHNYRERAMVVVVAKPSVDTKSPHVSSRLGVEEPVQWPLSAHDSPLQWLQESEPRPDCILVDEAQFLTPAQVDAFFQIVVEENIPVIAYGIRTDFRSHLFPGSLRLMELAHSLEELKTICRCGRKAVLNARLVGGEFVTEGEAVVIDGVVEYESLCGVCYYSKVGPLRAKSV